MTEELHISVLGTPSVSLDGEPVTGFVSSKAQALVFYLVATGRTHTREALAGLLWSDMPDAAARRNLRNALSNLRQLIGPYLFITRQTVSFNPEATCFADCERFTAMLSGYQQAVSPSAQDLASLSAAVALYRGEFLAGFYVADAPLFEEWALGERERLRLALEGALEQLVCGHSARGEHRRAIAFAQRWLAVDPLREAAHRALMELYAWSGDRPAALRQYEVCVQVLEEELGVDPSAETTELCRRIRAGELEGGAAERREPVIRGYEIRERIGGGNFGVVYRAYQTQVGREVAIKAILPQYANHPDFIRRFETESQLVARLEHPYIVPLYDYWREPNGAYLVMRWLRGGNLETALQRGPWNPEAATRLVDQISAALAAAHRQGVVHRDIKPANILLDEEDNAYLSDFGIAKVLKGTADLSQTDAIIGSPAYISPEQIRSEAVTPLSDIYSLGVVLYELLTGQHPFPEESLPALLHKHLNEALPSAGALRPSLPSAVDAVIQRATAKEPAQRFPDVLTLADAFRQVMTPEPAMVSTVVGLPSAEPTNPYKGLRPFYEADAPDFFGRDALTERLLARLAPTQMASIPPPERALPERQGGDVPPEPLARAAHRESQGRFLAVVGPSGSGKSSVVRAGLIPALRRGALQGSDDWFVIQMLPGAHPIEELEAALLRIAVNPPESLLNQMREDARGLLRAVKRALPDDDAGHGQSELVLLVDQFEEVFTLVEDESERAQFLDALITAVTDPRSRLRVIVTLRADFYDRPLQYAGVGELMRQQTEVVLPLSSVELERAIAGPAERVDVALEPGLMAEIVADVTDQPGTLPLLQYALTELFERRSGSTLTLEAYQEIGGVLGALGRRAEELYAGLSAEGQEAARQLFLRLVTLGEGSSDGLTSLDTRRRVLRGELESLTTGDRGQTTVMDELIELYGRYRLLTFDRDPVTRGPTVEVAHEALLREWGRLREWLDASREDLRAHRRLTAAATEWIDANQDAGFLLRGSRLDRFEAWAAETDLALTKVERDYLEASVTLREQRQAERERERALAEEQRRRAEIERQRAEDQTRRSRHLRWLAGGLAGALILAIVATAFARKQWNESQESLRLSISHRLTAAAINNLDRYPERSVLLALEAVLATYSADKSVTKEANHALRRALQASRAQLTLLGHAGPVYGVAVSLDGKRLATASGDRTAKVWDAASGEELITLSGHTRAVWSVAFSPECVSPPDGGPEGCGARLATASEDGMAKVWDVATGQELLTLAGHTGPVWSVAFSPACISQPDGGPERCGMRLATAGEDGTVKVWDVATGQELLTLSGHTGPVYGVAFSPECVSPPGGGPEQCGTRLVTASGDGTAKVWDVSAAFDTGLEASVAAVSGQELLTLAGHTGPVWSVAFSPECVSPPDGGPERCGTRLATGGEDGTARLWDAASGEELVTFSGHSGAVRGVAFFSPECVSPPDGRPERCGTRLATVSEDETVKVWPLAPGVGSFGRELLTLSEHTGPVYGVAFSPGGTRLFTASGDRTARVWNISASRELLTLSGHSGPVYGVAFSPECVTPPDGGPEWCGTRLVTTSEDGTARIWDAASGEELLTISGHTDIIWMADFSPECVRPPDGGPERCGERLATASADGTARIWDSTTGEELLNLSDHTHWVTFVAFNPDGSRLATASADGTARVWDAISGQGLLTLSGHTGWVLSVEFSPEGTRLATASYDGTARVWDAASGKELLTLSGHTGWVFYVAFSSDGTQLATAGEDGTARVWDAASGRELLTLSGHTGQVYWVAFSPECVSPPNGGPERCAKRLATAGEDGTVRIWDAASGEELLTLSGHTKMVNNVAFSPDGRRLAAAVADGMTYVYVLDMEELMALACSRITRNLTEAEWETYLGRDVAYRRTCPDLPVPPPWLTYDHID